MSKKPTSKSVTKFECDERFRSCAKEVVVSADSHDPNEILERYGYTEAQWRAGVQANAECKAFLDACYTEWHSTANKERRLKNRYASILEQSAPVLESLIKSSATPASAAVKGIEVAADLARDGTTSKNSAQSQEPLNISVDFGGVGLKFQGTRAKGVGTYIRDGIEMNEPEYRLWESNRGKATILPPDDDGLNFTTKHNETKPTTTSDDDGGASK
jgi:hypothetical protein